MNKIGIRKLYSRVVAKMKVKYFFLNIQEFRKIRVNYCWICHSENDCTVLTVLYLLYRLFCSVLYWAVLCFTLLYFTLLSMIWHDSTVQYSTVQYSTLQYSWPLSMKRINERFAANDNFRLVIEKVIWKMNYFHYLLRLSQYQ